MSYVSDIYRITSEFGAVEKVREGVHTGIDLSMKIGTKLRSVVDGEVKAVFNGSEPIGRGVRILGIDGREYIYGHMDRVFVRVGEVVPFGEIIGESGNSGNSTGPHLHFAVRENGEYINPIGYKKMLNEMSGNLTPSDVPFWDVKGKVEMEIKEAVAALKAEIIQSTKDILHDLAVMIVDLSFGLALIGGTILLLTRAMGNRKSTEYFWLLMLAYVIIITLFGGLRNA